MFSKVIKGAALSALLTHQEDQHLSVSANGLRDHGQWYQPDTRHLVGMSDVSEEHYNPD